MVLSWYVSLFWRILSVIALVEISLFHWHDFEPLKKALGWPMIAGDVVQRLERFTLEQLWLRFTFLLLWWRLLPLWWWSLTMSSQTISWVLSSNCKWTRKALRWPTHGDVMHLRLQLMVSRSSLVALDACRSFIMNASLNVQILSMKIIMKLDARPTNTFWAGNYTKIVFLSKSISQRWMDAAGWSAVSISSRTFMSRSILQTNDQHSSWRQLLLAWSCMVWTGQMMLRGLDEHHRCAIHTNNKPNLAARIVVWLIIYEATQYIYLHSSDTTIQ